MFGRRKTYPSNARIVPVVVYDADIHAKRAASLGLMTNTLSPGAVGVHRHPDRSPTGYTGDPGFGVNRWAGDTQPLQNFFGLVGPITHAKSKRLGAGAGASGQPGLPSTGADVGDTSLYGFAMPPTVGWGS